MTLPAIKWCFKDLLEPWRGRRKPVRQQLPGMRA